MASPQFPYETCLGEMEDLEVIHTAEHPDEMLNEDERFDLTEEVAGLVNVAFVKERHGEDYESWFRDEIPKLDPSLSVRKPL